MAETSDQPGEATQAADNRSRANGTNDEKSSGRRVLVRIARAPATIIGLVVAALVTFLVNYITPGAIEAVRQAPPLQINASDDEGRYGDGWSIAFAGLLNSVDQPPPTHSCAEARRWMLDHGGIDVSHTFLKMVIQGAQSQTIVIRDMRAQIEDRQPPIRGTLVQCPSAGENSIRAVGFDLDSSDPRALIAEDPTATLGKRYFEDNWISLDKGEPFIFSIDARTDECYCTWRIAIDVVVNGKEQTIVVPEESKPFRTTAESPSYNAKYDWDWSLSTPHLVPQSE